VTAIRMVYLDCDTPDCMGSTSDDSTPATAAEARQRARELGWHYRNGQDICPDCIAGDGPVSY
jgi:hypothetical protein